MRAARKAFGRRGATSVPEPEGPRDHPAVEAWRRHKLAEAYEAIELRTKSARNPWLEAGLAVVMLGVLLAHALMLFADLTPEAVDREPGLQVAAGPYLLPDGCPARLAWRAGDWVALACRNGGAVLPRHRLDDYGLGRPRDHRGRRRRALEQEWIRVGPDALLIRCGLIGCRVTRVVADRFSEALPAPTGA